jgi:hypothetical protein
LSVASQVVALEWSEVLEDAGGGRRGAGAVFAVQRQLRYLLVGHRGAEFACDEAAGEQRDELAGEERFDAGGALERDRGGVLDGLSWWRRFSRLGW